ncbi:unnamed protein product, partial [Protopolystoma xenopodis]
EIFQGLFRSTGTRVIPNKGGKSKTPDDGRKPQKPNDKEQSDEPEEEHSPQKHTPNLEELRLMYLENLILEEKLKRRARRIRREMVKESRQRRRRRRRRGHGHINRDMLLAKLIMENS